jgi:phospholipid transport system substrate-binding protein
MSLRRPFTLLVAVVLLGFSVTGLRAAPAGEAVHFINELVKQALTTLNDKQMSDQERAQRFRTLLDANFDIPRISRFVLGRYWNQANDQERQQFQQLFEEYVVRTYATRFRTYGGEAVSDDVVKVTGSRPESETSTIVTSQIRRADGAPPVRVDWRVRKGENGLRIVDVDVEGVSMALTQREEFSAVIQRNGGAVAGLNRELEQKLASGDTSLVPPIPSKKQ